MSKAYLLPDISDNSRVYAEYVINNKSYFFVFDNRDFFVFISVYQSDDLSTPIIEGYPLCSGVDVFARVKDSNIFQGKLILEPKLNNSVSFYSDSMSDYYQFVYYSPDEGA